MEKVIKVEWVKKIEFEKQLNRLNNKRSSSGLTQFGYTVSEPYWETVSGKRPFSSFKTRYVDFTILGKSAYQIGGYDVIGMVDNKQNLVFKFIQNDPTNIHKFAGSQECEHCNVNRMRNKVYIMRDVKSGKLTKVGSTCLADFTGIDVNMFSTYKAEQEIFDTDEWSVGGGGMNVVDLEQVLFITIQDVRKFGYYSSSATSPTKFAVYAHLNKYEDFLANVYSEKHDDADRKLAKEIREYFKGLDGELNDYMFNLKSIASEGFVPDKAMGFAVSMVPTYENIFGEKEIPTIKGHFYNPKERLVLELTFLNDFTFETFYGTTFIQKFRDAENREFTYKGSSPINDNDLSKGDKVIIKATIKHGDYKGEHQTLITRPKVHR